MMYSLEEAKKVIIKAGLELVKQNLIARTWGNISAKINDKQFLITPSGIPYDEITENNLVIVNIDDCSYEGNIKPSGEKKVHAAIYKARKDVTFILHTHQNYATAISVDGIDKNFAPVAKYGLPSTKKLVKNIIASVNKNPNKSCFLMQRHGVLVLSSSYEDAFKNAVLLEEKSKELYEKVWTEKSIKITSKPYLDDYAQMFGNSLKAVEEDKEAIELIKYKNTLAANYFKKPVKLGFIDVFLQHLIYKKKYSKLKNKNK